MPQLLARFAAGHEDGAELAFEALVERHGPMVFRVCRGVLRDEHAAEDAFQATFLVLARKARSLWVKDSLASWLHGVAHRVAARARSDAARRRRHEQQLAEARGPALEVMPDHPRSEAWAILSEEIARLPETYRAPVVLCYLEAMSYQAAAASLGVTEDTVRGRLARARERLRKSLARRGVEVPAIVAAARPAIPAVVVRHRIGASHGPRRDRPLGGRGGGPRRDLPIGDLLVRKDVQDHDADQTEGGRGRPGARSNRGRRDRVGPAAWGRARSRPDPATKSTRPPKAVAAKGGNFIVDWIPADGQGGKKQITVDPTRHCIHMPWVSQKRDDRPNDGAVRVDLERGKYYKVTAAGEAFMSEETGADADPFPGVVVIYPTDEEDCYAIRQIVLAPGKSITFRSPWLIAPNSRRLPDGVLPRHLCRQPQARELYAHHRGDRRTGRTRAHHQGPDRGDHHETCAAIQGQAAVRGYQVTRHHRACRSAQVLFMTTPCLTLRARGFLFSQRGASIIDDSSPSVP